MQSEPKAEYLRFGPIDSEGPDDSLRVPPLRALISAESPANFALREVESAVPAETLPAAPRSTSDVGTDQLLALLYRQLRCLAGPRPDLDDIVQAAAERVLKALPRFEGRAQLSTWTYGVAYRTLLDHDRWYARFKRRYIFAEDEKLPEPRSRFDSESLLIEVERARRLYQALDQLPAAKRAVLILCDLDGLPAAEVAVVVGVSEATVRSRLRDGRAKLAELLERDPLFRPGEAQ